MQDLENKNNNKNQLGKNTEADCDGPKKRKKKNILITLDI